MNLPDVEEQKLNHVTGLDYLLSVITNHSISSCVPHSVTVPTPLTQFQPFNLLLINQFQREPLHCETFVWPGQRMSFFSLKLRYITSTSRTYLELQRGK
jgi:hypothetical protein